MSNPPHAETAEATGRPYNRPLGLLRLLAIYALIGGMLAYAEPTARGMGIGLLLVAAGEGLRLWAAGYLTKTERLMTWGPYRYTRNPLYLGRLSIYTGLCVMARLPYAVHWIVLAAGYAVFFGYYLPRKERVEPARLREAHGDRYERYRRAVPALFPSRHPYPDAVPSRWSVERLRANREHWMVIGLAAVTLFLIWRS